MRVNKEELIAQVLSNERIASRVKELDLSQEQIEEALPILLDMYDEVDDENTKYLTSFFVASTGSVQRYEIKSTFWKKFAYLENVVLPDIFKINFQDDKEFFLEESRKEIVNYAAKYVDAEEFVKGIYAYGDYGIGKTFIFKRIAKKLAENGKKIAFVNVADLSLKVKSTFGTERTAERMIQELKEVEYLFLDDIGSEQITSWFRDDVLFAILNNRMQMSKTTFFTSNFDLDRLVTIQSRATNSKYPDKDKARRLIERIKAVSIPFKLEGKNKR